MKKKVLISWRLLADNIKDYKYYFKKKNIDFDIIKCKQYLKERQILKIIHKYNGIICGDDEITEKVINKAKNLKIISKWGTGIDSININYAKKKGIKVLNSPGFFTKNVAQHALGLLFSITRNIIKNHFELKNGLWSKNMNLNIEGLTVGIIGYGKIGKEIKRLLKNFKVKFLINDNKKKIKNITNLSKLLKNSDIVFVSCDLNHTSKNLINYQKLKIMKKSSIIINIARGQIINNNDLYKALKKKIIGAAGLDVFESEPIDTKSCFLKLDNCVLTSHNGFNSLESINAVNLKCVNNLIKNL